MSYFDTTTYRIVPKESYKIIRNCSGCNGRSLYVNTGNFRVNANGNRIDVWLIYRCETCRHTYNLTVYERKCPMEIPKEEYRHFMQNDAGAALRYGLDKAFFAGNRAEIDWEQIFYEICPVAGMKSAEGLLVIDNPYELKLRTDKVVAEIFHMARSKVRQMVKDKKLEIPQNFLGRRTEVRFLGGEINE